MMEVSDDYIYFKDRNHVFTGASQTLVSITDPSEHWTDLIGLTDYDVFPENYADKYYSLEKKIFSGEVKVAHEIQPTLDNRGNHGWVDNRKYPITNDHNEIIGLFGIARDISDIKALQQTLEEKVEQLETSNRIFDEAGDAIALIKDNHFIDCNKATLKLLEIADKATLLSLKLADLSPEKQPDGSHSLTVINNKFATAAENGICRFEWVNQLQNGQLIDADITLTAITINEEQVLHIHWRDITERKVMQQAIEWQATHDPLTGLPNRALLSDRFERAIKNAKRKQKSLLVCMLDLDHFKPVNDTYGHDSGDKLIVLASHRLEMLIRGSDTACRIGGDEFVILLCDLETKQEAAIVLQRILESISEPYAIDSHNIHITASIGVALFPDDDVDPDTLLRHADQAMYIAKQSGRNRIQWFDVDQDKKLQGSLDIINQVQQAYYQNQLCLYYQPKVNLRTRQIIGMEALLRWRHPDQGIIPPMSFLPLIEQTELIIDIGEWVMQQALSDMKHWLNKGFKWEVSINIAAKHFHLPDFHSRLINILSTHPEAPPQLLEIEIVETVALEEIQQIRELILKCQKTGIKFALDDFGTGFSSLSYLKKLPADTLKIDQAFVRDILTDKDDLTLVQAIIGLAHNFKLNVIAEGVETEQHGELLVQLGCDLAQGYGIAKPMPKAEIINWAEKFNKNSQSFL